jgi:phenylacetate-coenzyme A ligase PaaK-like adenylate-forming protein
VAGAALPHRRCHDHESPSAARPGRSDDMIILRGVTVAVQVVDPDTLERSVGKMRRVIDQRPR